MSKEKTNSGRYYFFIIAIAILLLPSLVFGQVSVDKGGKSWKLQLKSQFLHDDNVAQNPDKPPVLANPDSDNGWNGSAAFNYTHKFNNKFSLAGDVDIDATIYSDLGQFDLIAFMGGIKPKYKFNENMFVDMQYFYMRNIAGGNDFSGVNYVNPSFNHLHKKFGLTRVHYFYKNTDNFVNQARDGDQHGGGITHIYLIPNSRHYIGAGYQISGEDTVGRFDRTIHDFKVLGRVMLPMEIELNGEYKFSFREYDTFAATTVGAIRDDEQHNFRFRFRKVLWDTLGMLNKVTARIDFHHQNNESNFLVRDYHSNRFMGGLEARF